MDNKIKSVKAVVIDKNADPNTNANTNCVLECAVEFEDGTVKVYAANSLDDLESRQQLTESVLKMGKSGIPIEQYKYSNKNRMAEYHKSVGSFDVSSDENIESENNKKVSKGAVIGGTVGAATLVGTAAIAGAIINANNSQEASATSAVEGVEVNTEYSNTLSKIDMIGQDWDYYIENANDSVQKQAWTKVGEFLLQFNNSQSWMTRVNNAGENSVFGLTPEEAMALHIRMNEYTDEELITILNGTNINADEIMNLSNDALEKMNLYYRISNAPSGIGLLFNDEHDQKVIQEFEGHHIKMMMAEGKEKETLMQEEKQMYQDYFNSDVESNETKNRAGSTSYLLRTMLPASQGIADLNNYKDIINLYKISDGSIVEVKADLFDDIFMCRYITGFENFDEEHFIKQLGYNADKYYTGIDGTKRSIADMSCGEQEEKLRNADEYRLSLETSEQVVEDNKAAIEKHLNVYVDENGKVDANQISEAIDNFEFSSEAKFIAELTKDSYHPNLIASMLSAKLEELGKTPVFADTFFELYTEMVLKMENSKVSSTKGSTSKTTAKKVETTSAVQAKEALISFGDTPEEAEKKIAAAEEKAAAAVGAERDTEETKQKHEKIAQEDMVDKQKVYDETYSYYSNGGSGEYKYVWANSSDADIREVYQIAKKDGMNHYATKKQVEENNNNNKPVTPEIPDYVAPGTVTTDPTGNVGTIEDVIEAGNSEDPNKDNVIPDTTIPMTPSIPETPSDSVTPPSDDSSNIDYAPIVEEPQNTGTTDPEYKSEEEIIAEFEAQLQAQTYDDSSYDMSVFSAMDEYSTDVTVEETGPTLTK